MRLVVSPFEFPKNSASLRLTVTRSQLEMVISMAKRWTMPKMKETELATKSLSA